MRKYINTYISKILVCHKLIYKSSIYYDIKQKLVEKLYEKIRKKVNELY
jgi:hypothetical protein